MARAAQAYLAYTHTVMYATTWKRLSLAGLTHRSGRAVRRVGRSCIAADRNGVYAKADATATPRGRGFVNVVVGDGDPAARWALAEPVPCIDCTV